MDERAPVSRSSRPRFQRVRWWNAEWFDVLQFTVFVAALLGLAVSGAVGRGYNWQWYRVPEYLVRIVDGELLWGPLARGLIVTLELTGWSILITLAIGITAALLRLSASFSGRVVAKVYLEGARSTPLLIQVYLFYFVLGPILGLDRFWVGVLALSVFEGAFSSEVIRAGILSVRHGQWEAGASLGLSRVQLYRSVVLPQAIPLMLPPLTGIVISLIRNSAIVSVIAVFDLTTEARNIISETFLSFEIWITVAVIYLAFTLALSAMASRLEHRVRA